MMKLFYQRLAEKLEQNVNLPSVLTKRFEMPLLTKIYNSLNDLQSALSVRLGVKSLSVVTIIFSLLCWAGYFCQRHVRIEFGVWCWFWAMLGPIFCLFLCGLLLVTFIREERRQGFVFLLGMAVGLATFFAWSYICIYNPAIVQNSAAF